MPISPNCGGLAAGNEIDCDYKQHGGTEPNILIINKVDWDLAVTGTTITFSDSLITAIALTTGDLGYLFESFPDSVKPVSTSVLKASGLRYKQSIEFVITGGKAAVDAIVDSMVDERYVVIYINTFKDQTGQGKYKVLGVDAGLKIPDGGAVKDTHGDNDGAWLMKLENTDLALESVPLYTFWHTSEAVTDDEFVTLQSAAS